MRSDVLHSGNTVNPEHCASMMTPVQDHCSPAIQMAEENKQRQKTEGESAGSSDNSDKGKSAILCTLY